MRVHRYGYVPLNCINLDTATEPNCGAGNFIYAISQRMDELGISAKEKLNKILGIELYDGEAEKAKAYGATIETSDFFGYYKDNICGKKTFDVVLGNPPFIRYQNFEEKYRNLAFELSDEIGIKVNRLPLMGVEFVRYGMLTVVPFPFKYLREYIVKEDLVFPEESVSSFV